MILYKDILDEKHKILHTKSKPVTFPLSADIIKLADDMKDYLYNSQKPEVCDKYNLRPGMGLSPVQLGKPLRFFVIVFEKEEGLFDEYEIFNPEIVSVSDEEIFVYEGEGCLSVNRPTDGPVLRHARCTFKGKDRNGNDTKIRVREEVAIAFQHELDHLNGILFTDKIDPKKNEYIYNHYRSI